VGAFHGLYRDRSNARRFPAIDPLDSWSKYQSFVPGEIVQTCRDFLYRGRDINNMMMVVGEEGTSLEDFVIYLKSEFIDAVYLQQNAFDKVDAATSPERQKYVSEKINKILSQQFHFDNKDGARRFFYGLRQKFIDWNYTEMQSDEFESLEKEIDVLIKGMVADEESI